MTDHCYKCSRPVPECVCFAEDTRLFHIVPITGKLWGGKTGVVNFDVVGPGGYRERHNDLRAHAEYAAELLNTGFAAALQSQPGGNQDA